MTLGGGYRRSGSWYWWIHCRAETAVVKQVRTTRGKHEGSILWETSGCSSRGTDGEPDQTGPAILKISRLIGTWEMRCGNE